MQPASAATHASRRRDPAGRGPDHPLTHASRLNLASILVSEGATRRAETLLRAAEQSRTRDLTTVLTLAELAWLDARRRQWRLAGARLCEAERLASEQVAPRSLVDLASALLSHCGYALAQAGDHDVALEVFERARQQSPSRDDPRWYSFEIAEVLRAMGRHEEAIEYYDRLLAAWKAETWRLDARSWIARIYRGRAAAFAALSARDLKSARAWEHR